MPPRTAGPPLQLHRQMGEAFYVLDGKTLKWTRESPPPGSRWSM